MKIYKYEIEMICSSNWELHRALRTTKMKSAGESVAVEFATVANLGDNQFRYI